MRGLPRDLVAPIAKLDDLRPTQMTVGMREVKEKRKRFREQKTAKKQEEMIGKHMIPVVLGPDQRYYVVDHHHLARALHDEGVKEMYVTTIANLSQLDRDSFWFVLDNRSLMHPFDDKGRRCGYKAIPKSLKDLADNQYR